MDSDMDYDYICKGNGDKTMKNGPHYACRISQAPIER